MRDKAMRSGDALSPLVPALGRMSTESIKWKAPLSQTVSVAITIALLTLTVPIA